MYSNNTYFKQITGTEYGALSGYPVVSYIDGFYYRNVEYIDTFSYPTTTFGGSLTADILTTFNYISGGPISNYTYEDFSKLNSNIFMGIYFCTPTVYISLSSYDESVSPISKIIFDVSGNISTLYSQISTQTISAVENFVIIPPKNNLIEINLSPGEKYSTLAKSGLSVFKFDGTINTFTLYFSVLHCGILDLYQDAYILNSQILDKSNLVLLTVEDNNSKRVFNSILDTNIPFFLLSGGDNVSLGEFEEQPEEVFELETASSVFLASEIRQVELPVVPTPKPKINPITPGLAEYYYRGERGIRIRPLLARLLPRQAFVYAQPESGLLILSGGAPYFPGIGIRFNVEFREI